MILLDAHALVAYLRGEPAEPRVTALLREGGTAMGSVNLAEAVDFLTRRYAVDPGELRRTIEPIVDRALALVPFEAPHAWRAGLLRARYYHRTRCPVSAGDCALLALEEAGNAVATADPHVLGVARAEGVEVVALPSSS